MKKGGIIIYHNPYRSQESWGCIFLYIFVFCLIGGAAMTGAIWGALLVPLFVFICIGIIYLGKQLLENKKYNSYIINEKAHFRDKKGISITICKDGISYGDSFIQKRDISQIKKDNRDIATFKIRYRYEKGKMFLYEELIIKMRENNNDDYYFKRVIQNHLGKYVFKY